MRNLAQRMHTGWTHLCLPEEALVLRVAAAEGAHCQRRRLPDPLRP